MTVIASSPDHLLIPIASQAAYAVIRVNNLPPAKSRLGKN